mmetsp:Transcript_38352/g.95399  ORF Transcript_38352/g.95399 Transcript_38352/m.95399 type:complete len:201 (+) Transcript_38352:867-1469(+)
MCTMTLSTHFCVSDRSTSSGGGGGGGGSANGSSPSANIESGPNGSVLSSKSAPLSKLRSRMTGHGAATGSCSVGCAAGWRAETMIESQTCSQTSPQARRWFATAWKYRGSVPAFQLGKATAYVPGVEASPMSCETDQKSRSISAVELAELTRTAAFSLPGVRRHQCATRFATSASSIGAFMIGSAWRGSTGRAAAPTWRG